MTIERVTLYSTSLGQHYQNVLHFLNPDGALSHHDISEELKPNWISVIRNVQNNQLTWYQLDVQRVDIASQPVDRFPMDPAAGSLSGNIAPAVLCPLASIRTGVGGRRGHGRVYMPGLHGASVANGGWESGAFAAWVVKVANLETRYKSGGTGPITLGVYPRNVHDATAFLSCTALVLQAILGVQRRRNLGVGG
jgi:hypothetical protein